MFCEESRSIKRQKKTPRKGSQQMWGVVMVLFHIAITHRKLGNTVIYKPNYWCSAQTFSKPNTCKKQPSILNRRLILLGFFYPEKQQQKNKSTFMKLFSLSLLRYRAFFSKSFQELLS